MDECTPVLCTDFAHKVEMDLEEKDLGTPPLARPVYACCKSRTRIMIPVVQIRELKLRSINFTKISQSV